MNASLLGWVRDINGRDLVLALTLSATTFFISTAAMITVLVTLPDDYFAGERPPSRKGDNGRGALDFPYRVAKNLAGLALLGVGLVMAIPGIPGQGLLTMLTGLLLLDFPGQYRLVRKLLGRPKALSAVNHLRARFHKPPLRTEPDGGARSPGE